jgi:hypothetical protein
LSDIGEGASIFLANSNANSFTIHSKFVHDSFEIHRYLLTLEAIMNPSEPEEAPWRREGYSLRGGKTGNNESGRRFRLWLVLAYVMQERAATAKWLSD